MKNNKNNGLKGLLLILVIVLSVLSILIIELSQNNMRIMVTSLKNVNKNPVVNARISINDNTKISDENGVAFFKMRVSINDKLILKAEANGYKTQYDTINIDEISLKSKNLSKYILFDN